MPHAMADDVCFGSPAKSALPSYLFDTYLRYKQGTRAIVAWLLDQRPPGSPAPKRVSIGDLWDLAKAVRAKSKPLPEYIEFHFRETIKARKRLTQFFRDKPGASLSERSTTDHAFFTSSLSEIYAILCNCDEPCPHQPGSGKQSESSCPSSPSSNFYNVLESAHSEGTTVEPHHSDDCHVCHEPEELIPGKSHETPELADDQLGETLELMKIFKDIRDVCDAVNRAWEQAARGEIPLVLAAFVANVGFTYLKGYESQVQLRWDIKDPAALQDRMQGMDNGSSSRVPSNQESSILELGIADEHREIWSTLLRFREIVPSSSTRVKVADYQSAEKYITQDKNQNSESMYVFICCIADLAATGTTNSIVQRATPVFPDAARCLGAEPDSDEKSCPLRCTTGLMMMYEGYRSFLWPAGATAMTKSSPRIQALRLAKEATESIAAVLDDPTMPCRCCYTLAANLETFQLDLDAFLREKKFNLFFQAPWTNGSHILNIVERSFSYGMRLCSYRHYLGSVLHVYNLLTCLDQMLKIPFLEALCKALGDTVFPGGRPKSKFTACLLRSRGGRLKQSRKARKDWHLAIPKNSVREAAGFGLPGEPVDSRFQAKKLSLLNHIMSRNYVLDEETWDMIQKSKAGSNRRTSNSSMSRSPSSRMGGQAQHEEGVSFRRDSACQVDDDPNDRFSALKNEIGASELVVSEANALPIDRINFFRVYLAAVQAVSEVSDAHHEGDSSGKYCLCFVDELLRRGDDITDGRLAGKQSPFGYKALANACEKAIVRAFDVQDGNWSQFMWSHM